MTLIQAVISGRICATSSSFLTKILVVNMPKTKSISANMGSSFGNKSCKIKYALIGMSVPVKKAKISETKIPRALCMRANSILPKPDMTTVATQTAS